MKLSRKEREQRFRTELVLDVAESVFAERGFRNATVEEIASQAEFSVGSLYNLFPSKEDLFAAVVERRQDEFMSEARRQIGADASPLARLEQLAEFTLRYFEQHEAVFRLYVGATSGFLWSIRPRLGERSFQKHLEFVRFIADICRDGMAKERWPRSQPESLALAMTGMLNAFLTRWVTTDTGTPIASRVREVQVLIHRLVGAQPGHSRGTLQRSRRT